MRLSSKKCFSLLIPKFFIKYFTLDFFIYKKKTTVIYYEINHFKQIILAY